MENYYHAIIIIIFFLAKIKIPLDVADRNAALFFSFCTFYAFCTNTSEEFVTEIFKNVDTKSALKGFTSTH